MLSSRKCFLKPGFRAEVKQRLAERAALPEYGSERKFYEKKSLSKTNFVNILKGENVFYATMQECLTALDYNAEQIPSLVQKAARRQKNPPVGPARKPAEKGALPAKVDLIGRDRALQDIEKRCHENHCRLLVLTGIGGVGKTSLAIAAGHRMKPRYAQGVRYVNLVAVTDPARVVGEINAALGLPADAAEPKKALADWLLPQETLLILNNCEQIRDECSALAHELLHACPRLHILATSRHAFGGDALDWDVPRLELPETTDDATPETLLEFSALALFVKRAQAQKQFGLTERFELTTHNAPTVAEICRQLECIPLALELAAANLDVMTIEEMSARLHTCLDVLTMNRDDPRHNSMRAVLDLSYALLEKPEQALLRRLSVFAGGWMWDAAEEICFAEDERAQQWKLRRSLMDKNLLTAAQQDDITRFRLLEPIRQYAAEQLAGSEDGAEKNRVQERHRDYYSRRAKELNDDMGGPGQARSLNAMQREHANLERALKYCSEDPEGVESQLLLLTAMQEYLWTRAHPKQALALLLAALSRPGAQNPTMGRAGALNALGTLALNQGDYAASRRWLEECVAIYQKLEQWRRAAIALGNLAGPVHYLGDTDHAVALLEESLKLHRRLDNQEDMVSTLGNLAIIDYERQAYQSAQRRFEECLLLSRSLQDRKSIARCLEYLGRMAFRQNDFAAAQSLLRESLLLGQKINSDSLTLSCLDAFAELACKQGRWARAICLYGGVAQLQTETGLVVSRSDAEYPCYLAQARGQLGGERCDEAWAAGQAMDREEQREYALNKAAL